jgi:hypothetical protein
MVWPELSAPDDFFAVKNWPNHIRGVQNSAQSEKMLSNRRRYTRQVHPAAVSA